MAINKQCKQCSKEFIVEDEDLEFYKKISPTFAGKTFEIPAPTLCPKCREIRRLSWRNERSLYRRKSDKTGKEIVTMFSPDKTDIKIYSPQEWWEDDWDATQYAVNFDFSKSFFKQIKDLYNAVPQSSLKNMQSEGCEFSNFTLGCKNCYMSVVCYYGTENTHYSWGAYYDKDCVDTYLCDHCEKCYRLVGSNRCYNCNYSNRLLNCRDCYFSQDLVGCSDCVLCSNMNRKQYCIENTQYTKEEYLEKLKGYNFGSIKQIAKLNERYKELVFNSFVKYARFTNCENCSGDDLLNCKNCYSCFSQSECENVKYSLRGREVHNSQDYMGGTLDWVYESVIVGWGSNYLFCVDIEYCANMIYCISCYHSKDCFGCVDLRNKQYCIFNKQHSKEEYEEKVAEIIVHLQKSGEWGEFFPVSMSPFGYNETLGNDYCPLQKETVANYGLKWQDNDYSLKYKGQFYEPKDDISDYIENKVERDKLLAGVLKCKVSGKPFKIMPQELAFYLDNKIPIPMEHYDVRYKENLAQTNPKTLHHRQCMCEEKDHGHEGRCEVEFETTYAPDRPERVYCELCYQKEII